MKAISSLILFIVLAAFAASAQDSAGRKVYDRITLHDEGSYTGVITYDDKKDSIILVTDYGHLTFRYTERIRVRYNVARAHRETEMRNDIGPDGRLHIQSYARPLRLITTANIRRSRNKSIVLSVLGFAVGAVGAGVLTDAALHPYAESSLGELAGGVVAVSAGAGLSFGSMGSWISYARKVHKFKKQQARMGL